MDSRLKSIASAYNTQAESEFHVGTVGHLAPRYEIIKYMVSKYKNIDDTFIDVGGGTGIISLWLSKIGHTVSLVDVSERCVEYAKYISKKQNASNINFFIGSAEYLPEEISPVNFALCIGPTYHAGSINLVSTIIDQLYKKISTDGLLIISFLNCKSIIKKLLGSKITSEIKDGFYFLNELELHGHINFFDVGRNINTWSCNKETSVKLLVNSGFEVIDTFGFDGVLNGINWEFAKSNLDPIYMSNAVELMKSSCRDQNHLDDSSVIFFICKKY